MVIVDYVVLLKSCVPSCVRRYIKELERIYGIKNGNNQHKEESTNGGKQKTQADFAEVKGYVFNCPSIDNGAII